ncbi:MAG TPA: hypothetical protein VGR74_17220 [Actinomycetota bacterium]|nr:hypothetical protein [Actinomycetota bacterium]
MGSRTVRVRCGYCPRSYTRVGPHDYLRPSSLRARSPLKISVSAPWEEALELPRALLDAFPPGTRIRKTLPGQGGRLTFTCHPTQCRHNRTDTVTTRTVTFDRWTLGVEAVLAAGGGDLLIGGPGGL